MSATDSSCSHEGNLPSAKFCRKCGAPISSRASSASFSQCPNSSCKAVIDNARAKFCPKCGFRLASSVGGDSDSPSAASTTGPPPTQHNTIAPSAPRQAPELQPSTDPQSTVPAPTPASEPTPPKQLTEAVNEGASTMAPDGFQTLRGSDLTPAMLETSNANKLRNFRKGQMLGKGSYGAVYTGMDAAGIFYAVKQFEVSSEGDGSGTRFNAQELITISREIVMMQRLQHPNVCQFMGCFYDAEEKRVFIFLELVSGGALSGMVKKFKPIPALALRSYTRQILTGLAYLHSNKVVHRDIKCDNVLIDMNTSCPEDARVKLADFGASRKLGETITKCQTMIGTPYWMAPEILNNEDGYGQQADIWSLGCTVCEMVSGKAPWPLKENAPQALMMIARGDLPTEIPKDDLTPGSIDFVLLCFKRDPNDRPSADELLRHPWIQGEME